MDFKSIAEVLGAPVAKQIWWTATKLVNSGIQEDVEDMMSELFLHVWEGLQRYNPDLSKKFTFCFYLIKWKGQTLATKARKEWDGIPLSKISADSRDEERVHDTLLCKGILQDQMVDVRRVLESESALVREVGLRSTFQEPREIAESMNIQLYKVYRVFARLRKKATSLGLNF